jgi:hypothetical protein
MAAFIRIKPYKMKTLERMKEDAVWINVEAIRW